MAKSYVGPNDLRFAVDTLLQQGVPEDQVPELAADVMEQVNEERASRAFGEMSPLEQGWWAFKRGYRGVGEMITGALASPFGWGRNPIDIYKETTREPFEDVPSAMLPDAPAAAKVAFPIAGTLLQSIPMLHGVTGAVGHLPVIRGIAGIAPKVSKTGQILKAGVLGKAPLVGQVMKASMGMGLLGLPSERPFSQGAILGAAFAGPVAALHAVPGFTGLSAAFRLPSEIAAVTGGLTAHDMLRGQSLREQFDPRTPEGMQSLIDKGIAAGFTLTGGLKQVRHMDKMARAMEKAALEKAGGPTKIRLIGRKAERENLLMKQPLTAQEMLLQWRGIEDRHLDRTLRAMKKKIPKEWLTPQERDYRSLHRKAEAQVMIDRDKPFRQIFTIEGRRLAEMEVGKSIRPTTIGELRAPIEAQRKVDEINYRIALDDLSKEGVIKSPIEHKAPYYFHGKKATEGVRLSSKGKVILDRVKVDQVTLHQKTAMGKQRGIFKKVVQRKFSAIVSDPELIESEVYRRAAVETLGWKRGNGLWKYLTRAKTKGRTDLREGVSTYTTGNEYNEIMRNYKGAAIRALQELSAETTRTTGRFVDIKPIVEGLYLPTPLEDVKLRTRIPADAGILQKAWRTATRLLGYQDKHGVRTGDAWVHMTDADTMHRDFLGQAQSAIRHVFSEGFPETISYNKKWAPFLDAVQWMGNPKSAEKMGIPRRSFKEVSKHLWKTWKKSPSEVEGIAKKTWSRMHDTYSWLFAKTGMSFDKFRVDYLPHIVSWYNEGMPTEFSKWLIEKGVPKGDAQNFQALLAGMVRPPLERVTPRARKPFYEFERSDAEHAKDAVAFLMYEKDPLSAMTKYAQLLSKRTFKDPLLPLINDVAQELRAYTAGTPSRGRRIMTSMKDAVEAWYGLPSTFERYLKGYHPMKDGLEHVKELLPKSARKDIPRVTERNYRDIGNYLDLLTTGTYGALLGYSPWPILKNITQSNHNMVIFGGRKSLFNLLRYMRDPKFKQRVGAMFDKVRYAYLHMNPTQVTAAERVVSKFTETGLIGFRAADTMNVVGAISNSLDAWDNAMRAIGGKFTPENKGVFLEKLHLRKMRHGKLFWDRFRKLPGVKEIWKPTHTGSQSLGDAIWFDAQTGAAARAQLAYSKYMSYMTQYAYGGFETSPMFRGPLMRSLGMFLSWPANYAEYLGSLTRTGAGMEWLRQGAIWAAFLGLARVVPPKKLYHWFGFGAFPTELGPQSPLYKGAAATYKAVNTAGRATQGWLAGAEDDYFMMTADDRFAEALGAWGEMLPFKRLYEEAIPEDYF